MIFEYRIGSVNQREYDYLDSMRTEIFDGIADNTKYFDGSGMNPVKKRIVDFGYIYIRELLILKVKRGPTFSYFTKLDDLSLEESAAAAVLSMTLNNMLMDYRNNNGTAIG